MSNSLALIGLTGKQLGQSTVFSERSTVVGSAPGCGIVIKDQMIQPQHAELRNVFGRWFILPLDSQATILINGTPVQGQQRINPGDLVTLGSATFKVAFGEMEREVGSPKHEESHGAEDMWHD